MCVFGGQFGSKHSDWRVCSSVPGEHLSVCLCCPLLSLFSLSIADSHNKQAQCYYSCLCPLQHLSPLDCLHRSLPARSLCLLLSLSGSQPKSLNNTQVNIRSLHLTLAWLVDLVCCVMSTRSLTDVYLRLVGQECDVDLRQSLDGFRGTTLHQLVE